MNYHNENDPFTAAWLREVIAAGLIPPGEVDERSIVDVRPSDLEGYTSCHFFAGIGGWPYALRLAGWPDARPTWSGSCPCQPFSSVGERRGFSDDRHLWPIWLKLIRKRRPPSIFGEQVASAADWLALVRSDLERMAYAVGCMPIEAASTDADHRRDRFWFVAHGAGEQVGRSGQSRQRLDVADTDDERLQEPRISQEGRDVVGVGSWGGRSGDYSLLSCPDGRQRRVKPGIRLLAHGVPNRVGLLRGFGNAIDPRPAAAFIQAAMHAMTDTVGSAPLPNAGGSMNTSSRSAQSAPPQIVRGPAR